MRRPLLPVFLVLWGSSLPAIGADKAPHLLPEGVHPATLFASPDAAHFGYLLKRKLKVVPVIDGTQGEPVDWVVENEVEFSPNGKHTLFKARQGQRTRVIYDGNPGPLFDDIYEHALQNDHHAYVARKGEKHWVIRDGKEQSAEWDDIRWLNMTANGQLAYAARRGDEWVLHMEGQPDRKTEQIYSLRISSDGRRHAYIRRVGQWDYMVVDGQESAPLTEVTPAVFSPGGTRIAYSASDGGKWIAMIDGERQETMNRVAVIRFSSDAKRLALLTERGVHTRVIVDGREVGEFSGMAMNSFAFSPEGNHVAWVARKGTMDVLYVDGVERAMQERILAQHPVHFNAPDQIRLLAIEKRTIRQVQVAIP